MITRKQMYSILLIAVIAVGILVPILILTRPSGGTTYYTGNQTFETDLVVGAGQKVVFQDGEVTFVGSAELKVNGIAELQNVTFHGILRGLGAGEILLNSSTVNSELRFEGSSSAIISNSHIACFIEASDTANISIFNSYLEHLYSYNGAIITVADSWAGSLALEGTSMISAKNLSVNNNLYCYEELDVALENITVNMYTWLYDSVSASIIDGVLKGPTVLETAAQLDIWNSALQRLESADNSRVNVTSCSFTQYIEPYDNASVTIQDCAIPSTDVLLSGSASLTLINSTVDDIDSEYCIHAGTWQVVNNLMSGTGSADIPSLTLLDSSYDNYWLDMEVYGASQVLVNNSELDDIMATESANITLYNTTADGIYPYENGAISVYNSSVWEIYIEPNGTLYLEDVTIMVLNIELWFYDGSFFGSEMAFTGAGTWFHPTITYGPSVVISGQTFYQYEVSGDASVHVNDTSNIEDYDAVDNSNNTLTFCYAEFIFINDNANCSFYNSSTFLFNSDGNNITIFGSDIEELYLYDTTYAVITAGSEIEYLYYEATAGFWKSPDSTINNIDLIT